MPLFEKVAQAEFTALCLCQPVCHFPKVDPLAPFLQPLQIRVISGTGSALGSKEFEHHNPDRELQIQLSVGVRIKSSPKAPDASGLAIVCPFLEE